MGPGDAAALANGGQAAAGDEINGATGERVVRFDYDLVLTTTAPVTATNNAASSEATIASNDETIASVLRKIEEQLLERVGSGLDDADLCNGKGEIRLLRDRRLRPRSLRAEDNDRGDYYLKGLSSLPMDDVLASDNATCAEENLPAGTNAATTTCYPVAGYMTALYHTDDNAGAPQDEIQMTIENMIYRGVEESNALSTTNGDGTTTTADVYLVGIRGESAEESRLANPNMLTQNTKPRQVDTGRYLAGCIFGGLFAAVAVAALAFLVVRRTGRLRRHHSDDFDDNDSSCYDGSINQCDAIIGRANENSDIIDEEAMSDQFPATGAFTSAHNDSAVDVDSCGVLATSSYGSQNEPGQDEVSWQNKQFLWLARTLTDNTEATDATPFASNVTRPTSRYASTAAASDLTGQIICEEEGDDDYSESA